MLATYLGDDTVPPLLLFVTTLVVILLLKSWLEKPRNLPPSPGRPIPILGHLTYLGSKPREKLLEIRKTTGDIFSMYFGRTLVVFLSGYDVMKEALVKQADAFSARPEGGPSALLGFTSGIITNSGPSWKENRQLVLHLLKEFFAGKDIMSQKIMEEVNIYTAALASKSGEASRVDELTSLAVSNITCKFIFGKRFEYTDPFFVEFLHILDRYMAMLGAGDLHQWYPALRYLPGDLFNAKALLKLDQEIMIRVSRLIAKVQRKDSEFMDENNVISRYLAKMRALELSGQQSHLTAHHLERVVYDLMIGGSETTTTTLSWFYLYMMNFPDIQEKVYEEIVHKIGTNRDPNGQDKPKMHFVNATILETQRLGTISPFAVFHGCSRETKISGYTIPKGACIFPHLDSVMLDDRIWGDSLNFRPERFIKDGQYYCPEQFVGFGIGRRACLGESLARMELFLIAVSVIQKFKIVPKPDSPPPPRTYTMGSTCPPTPYLACFVERD